MLVLFIDPAPVVEFNPIHLLGAGGGGGGGNPPGIGNRERSCHRMLPIETAVNQCIRLITEMKILDRLLIIDRWPC